MDYNEKFISDYDEKKYLQCLLDPNELHSLLLNYNNRYMKNEKVDADKILFQESLNHYVIKKVKESRDFVNTNYFKNYKKYLQDALKYNTGFFFHNPFFHSFTKHELFQMFGSEFYNLINGIATRKLSTVKEINDKIKNKQTLSQVELNTICDVYAFNRDKDNEYHERLIEYIFSNLTPSESKCVCNKYVLDALLSYIPKSYGTNNSFPSFNVRIVADDKHVTGPGVSIKNAVFINRSLFSNTNFKSFEDAKKTYIKKGSDITFLMIVANHEITHQYQEYMSKKRDFSNEGYMMLKKKILNHELSDYKENHDNDDIEIDATEKGWEICASFYEKFIPQGKIKQDLVNQCHINSKGSAQRRFDYYKKDRDNDVIMETPFYDVSKLNEIIKRNPEYIKRFPMLQTFYKEDGRVNLEFLKRENICNQSVGADYICYMCMNSSYRVRRYLVSLNENDLNIALSNINYGFNKYKQKIIYWYQSYESEHKKINNSNKKTRILEQYNNCLSLYKNIMLILSDEELVKRKSYLENYKNLITRAMDLTTRQYHEFEKSGFKM